MKGQRIDPTISPAEDNVYRSLQTVRKTLVRLVENFHKEHVPASSEQLRAAHVELMWTLMLESYNRGMASLRQGLHTVEGVDQDMIDQSIEYALEKGNPR